MAKYVNNRFYFEKTKLGLNGIEEVVKEITEVVNTGITNVLYIWDNVYLNKDNHDRLCDFGLTVSKETREEEKLLIEKIWWKFINTRLESADKLTLGLWKSQHEIINEIMDHFEVFCEDDSDEQLLLTLRITPELINYLELNSFNSSKELKWFDFTLLRNHKGKDITVLGSTHSGHDNRIYDMSKNEVDLMLSQLDGHSLHIDILPTAN